MSRLAAMLLFAIAMPAAADDYDALFQKHGAAHNVDWRLLKAIGTVESHLNPRAENPDGLSAGIMQLLCAPAYTPTCHNRLNVPNWPPASRAQLYEPDYNVDIGTQVIAWNIRRYGLSRGIAAYNQWSARKTPRSEPFPNQYYVDKVLLTYRQLKATPAGGGANNTGSTGREGSRPYSSRGDRADWPS
jgi:soluble lytic murein transglycosylase-like protein